MKRILFLMLFGSLLLTAAEVSGKWSGQWEKSPDGGPGPHYMVLKQDGATVTGTAGPAPEQQMAIGNGKIDGSKLTFDIGAPNGPSLKFEFQVDGDKMNGQAVLDMGGKQQTLKLAAKRITE